MIMKTIIRSALSVVKMLDDDLPPSIVRYKASNDDMKETRLEKTRVIHATEKIQKRALKQ